MTDIVRLSGRRCLSAVIEIPWSGIPTATVVLDAEETIPSGAVELDFGGATLVGTVSPVGTGAFLDAKRVRVIAGGDGWSKLVKAKNYNSPTRIRRRTIAEDLAREVGEAFDSEADLERVGTDFIRAEELAGGALTAIYPGWRVDLDGVTRASPRATYQMAADGFEVLSYDPDAQVANCVAEDVSVVRPGAVITDVRFGTLQVRHVRIEVAAGRVAIQASGSPHEAGSRLVEALRLAVADPEARFFGVYRYRVITTHDAGSAIELQCASKVAGLPQVIPIRQWPGIGGVQTDPQEGAEVLVGFIDGSRRSPYLAAWSPVDAGGGEPEQVEHRADSIRIFGSTTTIVGGEEPMLPVVAQAQQRFIRWGDVVAFPLGPISGPIVPGGGGTMAKARSGS